MEETLKKGCFSRLLPPQRGPPRPAMVRGSHDPIHRHRPAPITKRRLSRKKTSKAANRALPRGGSPIQVTGAYFGVGKAKIAREPGFAKVAVALGMQAMCQPRREADFSPGPT
ncbi:UNVERIFIED_CONTAM: hypothetical protein K2H54_062158 [Gekko kuhli]